MTSLIGNLLENWSNYRRAIEDGGHHNYEHVWSMVIDLNKCTGCNACSTACYAENNLAWVGEDKFQRRQSLHWLRLERYWDEPELEGADKLTYQEHGGSVLPMMCQQCAAATCEPVCPPGATHHSPDGLNVQIYNRCIGSRYCANNCPFRVRYFNFYSFYETAWPEPMNQGLNPDITVRDKGVMEKCTFCIQRIIAAKDKAVMENRSVQDGDVQTACQQTCPTSAITFGDLLDPESAASKLWEKQQVTLNTTQQNKINPDMRGYRYLEEINTEPHVLYLERVRDV